MKGKLILLLVFLVCCLAKKSTHHADNTQHHLKETSHNMESGSKLPEKDTLMLFELTSTTQTERMFKIWKTIKDLLEDPRALENEVISYYAYEGAYGDVINKKQFDYICGRIKRTYKLDLYSQEELDYFFTLFDHDGKKLIHRREFKAFFAMYLKTMDLLLAQALRN